MHRSLSDVRRPLLLIMLAAAGVLASTVFATAVRADDHTAELSLSVSEAVAGDTITVRGSGFRVGTDGSFIYTSTITIGGVPIAGVASVDPASGYLHAARKTESGLYVAEHIDIDPANTAPDGAFTAEIVLPQNVPVGDHYLQMTSCWGGPDGAYPEDGLAPCGTRGFGGGVNDRVAAAMITIVEPVDSDTDEAVVRGPAGEEGPRGPEGLQSPQGDPGVDGRDGAQGPQGPQGLPGRRGPAGSPSPAAEALSIIALVVAIVALDRSSGGLHPRAPARSEGVPRAEMPPIHAALMVESPVRKPAWS